VSRRSPGGADRARLTQQGLSYPGATMRSSMRRALPVKRVMVKPGEALSLQMHHHRAEHWVVVSGTARVTRATR